MRVRDLGAMLAGMCATVAAACGFAGPGAASGPSSATSAPVPSIAPCAALSQSGATTITGDSSMVHVSSGATVSSNQCLYLDANAATITSVEITIEQSPGPVNAQTLQSVLGNAAKVSSGTYVQVPGIGDRAYSELGVAEAGLVFAKGGTLFVLTASSGTQTNSSLLTSIEQYATSLANRL